MSLGKKTLGGACHCGKVRVTVARKPRNVTDCNCSICRRYGVLWAYYNASQVKLAGITHTDAYRCNRKGQDFLRCKTCGCVICWRLLGKKPTDRIGINWRNFPLDVVEKTKVVKLNGAAWGGTSW